jgi:hypothetical protein
MSVDVEWSKGHVLMIGPYTLILLDAYVIMVNWRSGGALREKVVDCRLGRAGIVL